MDVENKKSRGPHYKLRPTTTPVAPAANSPQKPEGALATGAGAGMGAGMGAGEGARAQMDTASAPRDPFLRPEQEDDDGYDPYSDRPPAPDPLYQEDPWR